MLGYLILLFTLVPVIELALLIKIGQFIGVAMTVWIVILTGVSGAYLTKMQGLLILRQIQEKVNQGIMPADQLFDGLIILCSGILLITPGLITDVVGFLGLIPRVRNLLKLRLKRKIKQMIQQGQVITVTSFKGW